MLSEFALQCMKAAANRAVERYLVKHRVPDDKLIAFDVSFNRKGQVIRFAQSDEENHGAYIMTYHYRMCPVNVYQYQL